MGLFVHDGVCSRYVNFSSYRGLQVPGIDVYLKQFFPKPWVQESLTAVLFFVLVF